jgi:hypothetical protein
VEKKKVVKVEGIPDYLSVGQVRRRRGEGRG